MSTALITGGAGFIGSHLTDSLLRDGWKVIVIDNFDPFYDPAVKRRNIEAHLDDSRFCVAHCDIRDSAGLRNAVVGAPDVIVHLAAKAGVRPSIADPVGYQDVNVRGTQNVLELGRIMGVRQFVFASSSSVYGVNPRVPWREDDHVLLPISPYASTKVSGELMGHVYSHLYGMRFLALRLFTVYGPRQRPDLAIHKFARMMREGKAIPVFGAGATSRDYTYVADVVAGIRAAMAFDGSQYEVFNIGSSQPVSLADMIRVLASVTGISPRFEYLPEQPGDVPITSANIEKAKRLLGYKPSVDFADGVRAFWEQGAGM